MKHVHPISWAVDLLLRMDISDLFSCDADRRRRAEVSLAAIVPLVPVRTVGRA